MSAEKAILPSFVGIVSGLMERPEARQFIPAWLPIVIGTIGGLGVYFAEDGSVAEQVMTSLVQASSNWLGEWGFEGPEAVDAVSMNDLLAELRALRQRLDAME